MRFGDDYTGSGKHVRRVAWIARRGVEAEVVLDADLGRTELGQIAEDADVVVHACIFAIAEYSPGLRFSSVVRPRLSAVEDPHRQGGERLAAVFGDEPGVLHVQARVAVG